MGEKRIIIGTRGSRLAMVQASIVKSLLEKHHDNLAVEIVIIKTKGDIILDTPLAKIGDKGLFTKEIEEALLRHEVDLAVHSMKDLPTQLPPGLTIGAVLDREDPRDAFISNKVKRFADLPQYAVVATSSLRRRANVLQHRPDIQLVDIRGNVETRLQKLAAHDYDGMFLAVAGMKRLGLADRITEIIAPAMMLPAVTQGVLGIEIRADDATVKSLLAPLHNEQVYAAATAERAFLEELEGGCQVPIGALADISRGTLTLDGIVSDLDGKFHYRDSISGTIDKAGQFGIKLAQLLRQRGAQTILDKIYREKRA